MIPPRLHVLIARKAADAVVLLRGPSKQLASIGWNLQNESFKLGQWLKGRIYEHRADLSPDGRHMIYFAMNGQLQGAVKGAWTAVSRAPWLRAVHFYGWGHCWSGGGLFLDDRRYWLNRAGMGEGVPTLIGDVRIRRVEAPPARAGVRSGECSEIYVPKIRRDGWQQTGRTIHPRHHKWSFEKRIRNNQSLRKIFRAGTGKGSNGQCTYESHWLEGQGDLIPLERAEWADVMRSAIFLARDGALWRKTPNAADVGEARLIRDFSDMAFEPRQAPYAGIESGRPA